MFKHQLLALSDLFVLLTVSQLPFMYLHDAVFDCWTQGDLARVDELLTEQIKDPFYHAHALAQRALVRGRLKLWEMAIEDAKKVILRPSSGQCRVDNRMPSPLRLSEPSLVILRAQ